MSPSEILRRVALVRTDVSEEHITFIIRVRGIGELGTTFITRATRLTSQGTAFFIVIAGENIKSYIALTGWTL
jgi:hypothetical protein